MSTIARPVLHAALFVLAVVASAAPLAAPSRKDDKPARASAQQTKVADAPRPKDEPLPEKAQPPEGELPTVSIRNVKGARIEEYRQGNQLYMIRVVPEKGIPYTYLDTDGNGRLEYEGEDGPVRPVFYTLYEWD